MKTDNPLTIGQLKKWCMDNSISDDTPIGIYIGNHKKGDVAFGIIGDTKNEIDDEECCVTNFSETTGEHCYMKNISDIFEDANASQIIMITDGCHIEED